MKPTFGNTEPMVYPACQSGPCKGGTRLCITPEACLRALNEVETQRPARPDDSAPRPVWWRNFNRNPSGARALLLGLSVAVVLTAGALIFRIAA